MQSDLKINFFSIDNGGDGGRHLGGLGLALVTLMFEDVGLLRSRSFT